MIVRHYVIHGRVQGVSFRFYTRHLAERLGVRGWVRNQPDGSVEAVGAADEAVLEQFRRGLEQGPSLARVDRVDETPAAESAAGEGRFEIRY